MRRATSVETMRETTKQRRRSAKAPVGTSEEPGSSKGGHVMKSMTAIIVSIAVASAMVAMLASTGAAATPKKTVAFTASYSGTAAVHVTDSLANIQANGTGTGTLLGSGK